MQDISWAVDTYKPINLLLLLWTARFWLISSHRSDNDTSFNGRVTDSLKQAFNTSSQPQVKGRAWSRQQRKTN